MMRNALLVVGLVIWFIALPTHAQDDALYTCDAENCVDIFNAARVDITALRALSSYAYFQNPLLEMDVQLTTPNPTGTDLYMSAPHRLFPAANEHCDLLLVGLADTEGDLQQTIRIAAGMRDARLEVYAFCQNINLPGVEAVFPPFPSQATPLNPDNIESITENQEALVQVVNQAYDGTCIGGTWVNQPAGTQTPEPFTIGLDSLAMQFAIFVLFADDDQRETIWQQFLLEANNPIYERDFEAIYDCLLQPVDIARPAPTSTPTATPTVTPVFVPTATPTPVPILYQDTLSAPTGQSLSLLDLFIGISASVTLIILGIIGLSLLSIRRVRWLVIAMLALCLVVILGVYATGIVFAELPGGVL